MCLAVPAKILEIRGERALADFGGVRREIIISLIDREKVRPDDYVIVHTGYAISIMDQKEAEEILMLWKEILSEG